MSRLVRTVCLVAALAAWQAGCDGSAADASRPSSTTAEVSPKIVTVVTVRWTTAEPSVGYVEFGPSQAFGFRTPVEATPTLTHVATLLGLTANTVLSLIHI